MPCLLHAPRLTYDLMMGPSHHPNPVAPRQVLGQRSRRRRVSLLLWLSIPVLLITVWLMVDRAGGPAASGETDATAGESPPSSSPMSVLSVEQQAQAAVTEHPDAAAPASPMNALALLLHGAQSAETEAPAATPIDGASTILTTTTYRPDGSPAAPGNDKRTCFVKNSDEFRQGLLDDTCDFIQLAAMSEDDEVRRGAVGKCVH